jgi:hypothetical protein
MFAQDKDGKGRRKELIDAMERLFAAGKIKAEKYDRRGSTRLIRSDNPGDAGQP